MAEMANRGLLRHSRSRLARPPCGSGDICDLGGSSPQQASTSLEPSLSRAPATVDDQLRKDAGGSSSVSPTSPGGFAATQIHNRAPGHRAEVALGPSPSTWADVEGTFLCSGCLHVGVGYIVCYLARGHSAIGFVTALPHFTDFVGADRGLPLAIVRRLPAQRRLVLRLGMGTRSTAPQARDRGRIITPVGTQSFERT
jgi:hypothetical protein